MKKKFLEIGHKTQLSWQGVLKVFSMPRYAVFAVGLAFVFAVLIFFFIQIGFYGPLFGSRLPLADKLFVLWNMIGAMSESFFTSWSGFLLLVVSLLQGVAFALMVYTMRRNKQVDVGTVGGGGVAMAAAALGLGCVPCGTSLLMPILTLFFSSSAYAAANTASVIVLILAFFLSIYSVYRLGYVAYSHVMMEKQPKKKESNSEKRAR